MKQLGLGAYRFSIGWPRIQPDGHGRRQPAPAWTSTTASSTSWSARASSRWRRCSTGTCRRRSQDAGGWQNRATAEAFGEYAAICADRLGDRVGKWAPVNEPNVVTMLGHGDRAARARDSALGFDALPVAHHLNLAPRPRRPGAPRRTAPPRSAPRPTTRPVWRGLRPARGRRRRGPLRLAVEPDLRRPDAARPLPGGLRGRCCRSRTATSQTIRPAARLLRLQLLQPDADRRPPRRAPRSRSCRTRSTATRRPTSAGRSSPTGCAR